MHIAGLDVSFSLMKMPPCAFLEKKLNCRCYGLFQPIVVYGVFGLADDQPHVAPVPNQR